MRSLNVDKKYERQTLKSRTLISFLYSFNYCSMNIFLSWETTALTLERLCLHNLLGFEKKNSPEERLSQTVRGETSERRKVVSCHPSGRRSGRFSWIHKKLDKGRFELMDRLLLQNTLQVYVLKTHSRQTYLWSCWLISSDVVSTHK